MFSPPPPKPTKAPMPPTKPPAPSFDMQNQYVDNQFRTYLLNKGLFDLVDKDGVASDSRSHDEFQRYLLTKSVIEKCGLDVKDENLKNYLLVKAILGIHA